MKATVNEGTFPKRKALEAGDWLVFETDNTNWIYGMVVDRLEEYSIVNLNGKKLQEKGSTTTSLKDLEYFLDHSDIKWRYALKAELSIE